MQSHSLFLSALAAALFLVLVSAAGQVRAEFADSYSLKPAASGFTRNDGQWPPEILYRAGANGTLYWFTQDGVYLQYTRERKLAEVRATDGPASALPLPTPDEVLMLKYSYVGINPTALIQADGEQEHKSNFFLGNDPARWRTGVPTFQKIIYDNIYDGISLCFEALATGIDQTLLISPGADPAQVQMLVEGAADYAVDETGGVRIETPWGIIVQSSPHVEYVGSAQAQSALGSYVALADGSLKLTLTPAEETTGRTDRAITPTFSTYLGGSSAEIAYDLAAASTGEVYICGTTHSADFPVLNPYDNSYNSSSDLFVTKFNPAGNSLAYSTYLGGSGGEVPYALALYGAGSSAAVVLVGVTGSSNFPTLQALDAALTGASDAFVTMLASTGSALTFSTYLGGSSDETAYDVEVRCQPPCLLQDIRIFLTGSTSSSDFPVLNAFDATLSGSSDAFLTQIKLNTVFQSSLVYSTFYGGSSVETGYSVTLAPGTPLKPYITGYTASSNLPVANAYDASLDGTVDAFIAGFDVGGNGQLYALFSTYFGGVEPNPLLEGRDHGQSIVTRPNGNIVVSGTLLSNGLATQGAFDTFKSTDSSDAFVAEFTPLAASLVACTYLGGLGQEDHLFGVSGKLKLDAAGNVYVAGITTSPFFPTQDGFSTTLGGPADGYLVKLDPTLSTMKYGTYIGGSAADKAVAVSVDPSGCAYVCGSTGSSNFPIVAPYDGTNNSNDAFLTKICIPQFVCGDADGNGSVSIGDAVYIINYIFAGGPAPSPIAAGDTDCSGSISIGDAVYLINYIFAGGPAPCAGC